MVYTIGVSSGWWKIPKSPDLLGLAQKVGGFGATVGVRFIQADVETTSEFFEPRLKQEMKRVQKEMGMRVGLHGEIGELMSLESAERRLWDQSHLRLVETAKNAAEYGLEYIVIHMSNRPQLLFLEAQYRVTGYFYPVVSPQGKPVFTLCEQNENVKKLCQDKYLSGIARAIIDDIREKAEYELGEKYRQWELKEVENRVAKLSEDPEYQALSTAGKQAIQSQIAREVAHEKERMKEQNQPEDLYKVWKLAPHARYVLDAAEIGAYTIAAQYMKETGDPIWSSICGGDPQDAYVNKHASFNAACALKYMEGHLTVKDNQENIKHLNGMSIIEWLDKHNVVLAIEIPEAHEGYEALLRLFNPLHGAVLIKKLGSKSFRLCIDFEHMISHKMIPEQIIPQLPCEAVHVVHLTKPIPYGGTAHIPIGIGSKGQEVIYSWLYEMRKRGFKDGIFIFERGGGKTGAGKSAGEVMENSVWAMRQIADYLEKDIPPDQLPPEFFGIAEQNKETFARQMTSMRDHAWDPLEGLLQIPEEKHTFLSKAAVEKQKAELWEKRKWR